MGDHEARNATTSTAVVDDPGRAWRIEQYEQMGFAPPAAETLADARDDRGFPVYWGVVAGMLARGCSHDVAVEVIA